MKRWRWEGRKWPSLAREEQEESGRSGRGRERRPPETLPATKWQPHLFQSAAITPAEINPVNRPLNHPNDLPFRGLGCITHLRSLALIRTRKQEAEGAETEKHCFMPTFGRKGIFDVA